MNWGYRIMIVYVLFVAGIVFLVVKSSRQNQDLVTEDYYEQELKYEDKIRETERANNLSALLKYSFHNDSLAITLPDEMKEKEIKLHVLVYCIADKSKDLQKDFTSNNTDLHIHVPAVNRGLHDIKVTWEADGVKYYNEHKLFFQ